MPSTHARAHTLPHPPVRLRSRRRPGYGLVLVLLSTAALALGACDEAEPEPDAEACPAPTGEGVHHAGRITEDEVWRAADGIHWVDGSIEIAEGARVEIEPCVEIRMAPAARIEVGSGLDPEDAAILIVQGDAERPVRFAAAEDGQAWGSLEVHAPARLDLRHVSLRGGGGDGAPAAVIAHGDGELPLTSPLTTVAVQIEGSASDGIRLDGVGGFGPSSDGLTVTGAAGRPLYLGAHALGSVPPGDYTGNGRDAIVVVDDAPGSLPGMQADVTIHDRGVPYAIGEQPGDDLRVGANGAAGLATLTIEAGVTLAFQPEAFLRVVADEREPRGRLRIEGSALAPVTLTSAAAVPTPGDWAGVYFESPIADSDVGFATIAYAGGDCSCSLASCSPLDSYDAAVIFDGMPPGAFFHDSLIRDSAGHGIVRSWYDADIDFAEGVSFEGVAGCNQTSPMTDSVVCPDPAFACGGD